MVKKGSHHLFWKLYFAFWFGKKIFSLFSNKNTLVLRVRRVREAGAAASSDFFLV